MVETGARLGKNKEEKEEENWKKEKEKKEKEKETRKTWEKTATHPISQPKSRLLTS